MKIKHIYLIFFLIAAFSSCNDSWDEHYSGSRGDKSEQSLFELIKAQPDLSTFTLMLEKTGYDSILSKSMTYTVWAPVNSAGLDSIAGLSDTERIREVVMNHISRFAYPTAGVSAKTIFMFNKKFVSFRREGDAFYFGGKALLLNQSNVAANNGILHTISGYVSYLSNIWEYILQAEGLDSLRTFLDARSIYAFDPKASVEIGTNEFGQAVYDSVITFNNEVLDRIGYLHLEDSTYAALLPDNHAWTTAYNLIKNNYKTLLKDGGAPRQRLLTQQALVENLIFRQLNPEMADSVTSTTGSLFRQPAYIFSEARKMPLSNGQVYITDSLRFKKSESWQKSIVIEAENSDYGRSYNFANLSVRYGLGTQFSSQVSDNRYLYVESTTVVASQPASVVFPLPNTLSGKYRVYCVFLPSSIVSETDLRPYKVKFYFSYLNSSGTQVENAPVGSANQLLASSRTAFIFSTKGAEISKMFVTEIEFPYCNIVAEGAASTAITTRLKVENGATTVDEIQNKADRKLRIDYIILEPVQ